MAVSYFRIKACLLHLLISLLIASVSYYLVFYIWHPAPLAKAIGVTNIFLMMLAIDVVLGPILTLVVAKQGKKTLKFDLAVIIILQIFALGYGIYNIATNRPVYIAFDTTFFELVQAGDIFKGSLSEAKRPYQYIPLGKPHFVAVIPPKNDDERTERLFTELQTGVAPSMRPNLYEPVSNQWNKIIEKSNTIDDLYKYNSHQSVDNIVSQYPEADGWLPLTAYEQDMVILIDKKNRKILGVVDLHPWE